ncbi:hypothetical protein A9Q99_26820 [Gammaproteobacteria bacterium 45_16_T64]|nr:hypothetical protein A9Q99_26820 [Gammaproteobacteria bacterium 45_16_T64]
MKQIKTEITINSSKESIWAVLSDIGNYGAWNNVITGVSGTLQEGRGFRFKIAILGRPVPMAAKIHRAEENRYLGWGNDYQSWVKVILGAHHYFEIIEVSENECKFVHGEMFYGVIPTVLWGVIKKMSEQYDVFNAALKSKVER